MDPVTMITLASLGMQGASMFTGGSGGSSVSTKPPLSRINSRFIDTLGKELDARFKSASQGGLPNIAGRMLGQVFANYQGTNKATDRSVQAAATRGEAGMGSGAVFGGGFLQQIQAGGTRTKMASTKNQAQRDNYMDSLSKGRALYSSEVGSAVAANNATYQQTLLNARVNAQQGQILGNMAATGGAMYALPKIYGA